MASLKSADLFIGETFVTALPANTLEANLHYSLSNQKFLATSKTIFNDPVLSHIKGSANIEGKIKRPSNTASCNLLSCWLSDFNSRYRISLGDEAFYGESSCRDNDGHCLLASMLHKISTTDTAKVFEELNKARILNPFASLYLYSAITSGKKSGRGHEIIFN